MSLIFTPIYLEGESAQICSFCSVEKIDAWFINIRLPNKANLFAHVGCFEELGWSMARFVVDNSEKFGMNGVWNG